MTPRNEDVVVDRDDLIADGEDDRSTTESKDDAALLVRWSFVESIACRISG